MGKRESAAVYRRRRILALVLLLIPVALVLRSCSDTSQLPLPNGAPTSTSAPTVPPTSTPTSTATNSARVTETPTSTRSPKPSPSSATLRTLECANGDIEVTITADAEVYSIGSPVTMAMRITNTGAAACKRDVGALANEVYVTDLDGAVVWSSDACQKDAKPEIATMGKGAVFGNTQVWGGSNSGRDCTSAAADAVAGSYLAYARNDAVLSKPFAFTIQ